MSSISRQQNSSSLPDVIPFMPPTRAFFRMENALIDSEMLNTYEIAIYVVLTRFLVHETNRTGPMGAAKLIKYTGIKRTALKKYIKSLEEKGFIRIERWRKPGSPVHEENIFYLTRPTDYEEQVRETYARQSSYDPSFSRQTDELGRHTTPESYTKLNIQTQTPDIQGLQESTLSTDSKGSEAKLLAGQAATIRNGNADYTETSFTAPSEKSSPIEGKADFAEKPLSNSVSATHEVSGSSQDAGSRPQNRPTPPTVATMPATTPKSALQSASGSHGGGSRPPRPKAPPMPPETARSSPPVEMDRQAVAQGMLPASKPRGTPPPPALAKSMARQGKAKASSTIVPATEAEAAAKYRHCKWYDFAIDLAEMCQLDWRLKHGYLSKVASRLYKAGYRQDDLPLFMAWYRADWRGKKGGVPSLKEVEDHLKAATVHKQKTSVNVPSLPRFSAEEEAALMPNELGCSCGCTSFSFIRNQSVEHNAFVTLYRCDDCGSLIKDLWGSALVNLTEAEKQALRDAVQE